MTKQAFKTFLSYHWYAILGIFFVVSIGYYYIFDSMNTPTYEESVRVFIASEHVNVKSLEEKLFQDFEESAIKEVKVDYSDSASPYFSSVFQTRGLVQTDILILPQDIVPSGEYGRYFVSLRESILINYLSEEVTYYSDIDTLSYGIECHNELATYVQTNQKPYYVFLNKNSKKLGLLNEISSNDAALTVLANLFQEDTL